MNLLEGFEWTGSVERWRELQTEICAKVKIQPFKPLPRFIAGVDCAFSRDGNHARGAAVIWDRVARVTIESAHIEMPCTAPYIPTFLSFREIPPVVEVLKLIKHPYEILMCDGHGLAHPRRCGVATHMGVLLSKPSIGCAKSRLTGTYKEPGAAFGKSSPLTHYGETIGEVVRTRAKVKPIFVSVGHLIDLAGAVELALDCAAGYRLPEPTRLADKLSKFEKDSDENELI